MGNRVKLLDRPLAITDVETTGLDAAKDSIIEIGLVLVRQPTLEIINELEVKVRLERPELMSDGARAVNGYSEEAWQDALPLAEAIRRYDASVHNATVVLADALFSAHNPRFDHTFIETAYRELGLDRKFHYQSLDSFSVAWPAVIVRQLEDVHLNTICRMLGIPEEPKPHRAINGARCVHAVLKRMVEVVRAGLTAEATAARMP